MGLEEATGLVDALLVDVRDDATIPPIVWGPQLEATRSMSTTPMRARPSAALQPELANLGDCVFWRRHGKPCEVARRLLYELHGAGEKLFGQWFWRPEHIVLQIDEIS